MCGRPCSLRGGRANISGINSEVGMIRWMAAGLMVLFSAALVNAQATKPATTKAVTQEDLEKQFAQMLSGSTLVGKFTEERAARPAPAAPKEDRYTLTKVQKLYGDNWLFV